MDTPILRVEWVKVNKIKIQVSALQCCAALLVLRMISLCI